MRWLPTRTVVTTVPAAPDPLVTSLPCPLDRGRIVVDHYLNVPGFDCLWAVGDCASVPQRDGITSPPTAQHAVRQAKVCATNLLAIFRGQPKETFKFTGLGKLASLGRRSAVAEVMGIKLRGVLAWLAWKAIYLSKIPGWDRMMRLPGTIVDGAVCAKRGLARGVKWSSLNLSAGAFSAARTGRVQSHVDRSKESSVRLWRLRQRSLLSLPTMRPFLAQQKHGLRITQRSSLSFSVF